ncbi:MAG: phage tail fiber protein [Candidatus Nanoarchaeia archaeon]
MGDLAHYMSSKILDEIFGGTNYVPEATLYLGLSTSTIADDGTNITEPTDSNYARVSITNNKINWDTASVVSGKSQIQNAVAFEFPAANTGFGTITDWFISDAASGGNIIAYGALNASKTIGSGEKLIIPIDGMTITLD